VWVTGKDNAKEMRRKWGDEARRALLPLQGGTNPVIKILRKGAPAFPASIRYIHSQMERACHGQGGRAGELLRDIARTWAIGTFSDSGASIGDVVAWCDAPSERVFAHIVARSGRSAHLHGVIQSFVRGVAADSAAISWAMRCEAAFPYVGAVWAMLRKIARPIKGVAAYPEELPACVAVHAFSSPLISAKRLKAIYTACTDADKQRVDAAVAWRCQQSKCQMLPLSTADDQSELPPVYVPYCGSCGTWRWGAREWVKLDLATGQGICACGGKAIESHLLNNACFTTQGRAARLCSKCAAVVQLCDTVHVGARGLCQKCADDLAPVRPPCIACGLPSVHTAVAGHTQIYGMCENHTLPVHYSCTIPDIVKALRARSQ
jgi:hypothetical protein